MFKSRFSPFVSAVAFMCLVSKADTTQMVDVVNNSEQPMSIAAKNANDSFNFNLHVPAYAKACVIAKVTALTTLQDQLFMGIFNDSPEEILKALAAGAKVNALRDERTPLDWALSFGMVNAAICLLQNGGR